MQTRKLLSPAQTPSGLRNLKISKLASVVGMARQTRQRQASGATKFSDLGQDIMIGETTITSWQHNRSGHIFLLTELTVLAGSLSSMCRFGK